MSDSIPCCEQKRKTWISLLTRLRAHLRYWWKSATELLKLVCLLWIYVKFVSILSQWTTMGQFQLKSEHLWYFLTYLTSQPYMAQDNLPNKILESTWKCLTCRRATFKYYWRMLCKICLQHRTPVVVNRR